MYGMEKDPFKILIVDAQLGLRLIMKKYGQKLKILIKRYIGGSRYLLKDVIQEIHIELVSRSEEIAAKEDPVAWMMKMAKYKTSNMRRKDHQPEKLPIEEVKKFAAQESADGNLYYKEIVEQISQHIHKLAPKEQKLLKDSVFNGLSNEEIERKYNLNAADVRNTKSVGIKKLRNLINKGNQDNSI